MLVGKIRLDSLVNRIETAVNQFRTTAEPDMSVSGFKLDHIIRPVKRSLLQRYAIAGPELVF